jgi:hypothetical protein
VQFSVDRDSSRHPLLVYCELGHALSAKTEGSPVLPVTHRRRR